MIMKKIGWFLFIGLMCLIQTICYAAKTSTGFNYPLDNFSYSSVGTWLGPGNGSAGEYGHIGVDMLAPVDKEVKSIADGVVDGVSYNGWNLGSNSDNVAVLIKHTLHDGRWFIALYGHIKKDTAIKSGIIKAGATVGYIGNYGDEPHLHFGIANPEINPGPTYGYSTSENHNGFTDPIAFIKNNAPYIDLYGGSQPAEMNVRMVGNIAWYPSNVECFNAVYWLRVFSNFCEEENVAVCFEVAQTCPAQY